jgi:ketosteroid isomerase-like protein
MDPKALLKIWIEAFQATDLPSVVDCYAEDAINFQVAAGEPALGENRSRRKRRSFFEDFRMLGPASTI